MVFNLFSQFKKVNEGNSEEKDQTTQIEEIEQKINQLKEAKDHVRCEIQHFDECIQKNSISLKSKEQEISSKKIIMENILLQQADKAFQDYIEQQSQVFEGLQKTYGNKALQQIKIGHHKQFREIMKENQDNRMQKFEEVLICIDKINKTIKENIKYVDSQLSEDLNKIQKKIQLEIDYQSILQKEKEFTRQFDSLIQAKKVKVNDLLNDGGQFTSQQSYEKVKYKVQRDIENCESEIKIIENNIKGFQRLDSISNGQLNRFNDTNLCFNNKQHLKSTNSNDLSNNSNIAEDNVILVQMKKQLDEFQIQRFALESKLIEINFNINPSSSQGIEQQKENLLQQYIQNNNQQLNQDGLNNLQVLDNESQIEAINVRQENERKININNLKKYELNNSFISEKEEINSRSLDIHEYLKNLNNHLEISIPYLDSMSGSFSPSKKGSIAKYSNTKTAGEINQKQMKSNLQNENVRGKENLSANNQIQTKNQNQTNIQFDQSKNFNSAQKKLTENSEINPNLFNLSEYDNSQKNNQLKNLESSASSFFESQNSEQIFNKSQNNSSTQFHNVQFHQKQSPSNSLNNESYQNQYQQKSSQQSNSQSSIVTMIENKEENQNFNHIIYHQSLQQRNSLNQKQQQIIMNEHKFNNPFKQNIQNNIQQTINQQPIKNQIQHVLKEEVQLNQNMPNQIHPQQQNQNFSVSENNSRRNSNSLENQSQYNYQCHLDLGHTLQTITEEQISTNRGLSARNNLQYQGISNQIQNIQNQNQIYKQPYYQQNNDQNKFQNLSIDHISIMNNCNQSQDLVLQNNTDYYKTQQERQFVKNQQIQVQQPKIIKNNQNPKLINHNRCRSLIQNPQENQDLYQNEIQLKNDQVNLDIPANRNSKIQQLMNISHYQVQSNNYNNISDLQQEDINQGYNQQSNNQYYDSKINFYQQENVCPNIRQPSISCKSSQNQKNIQPLLNNTFHFTDMQKQQILSNETCNVFTPSSNIEISFNSYLNSSLNRSRQMSKKNKNRGIDNKQYMNTTLPNNFKKHSTENQEYVTNNILNNQITSNQNQFFDNQNQSFLYNQSQRLPHQQYENQNVNLNYCPLQNNLNQQQYSQQAYGQDNQQPKSMNNYKKRRSKSEEMKNICNSMFATGKSNQEIKLPQTLLTTNRIRSKSQSIYQNQPMNKHLQQQLLHQQQQQQHQNQPRTFIFKLHLESLQNKEAQFLIQIKGLLEGSLILKKFSQYQSLKQNIFNPFTCEQLPPENCGFGLRLITLHKNLTKIEIRHPLKQGTIESTINIDQILRHQIPNTTAELVKLQKQNEISSQKDINLNSINRNICSNFENIDQIQYYAFSIVLDKGGRIDFIAQNYKTFNMWTSGLQQLIKQKKLLPRLKNHIEQIQII